MHSSVTLTWPGKTSLASGVISGNACVVGVLRSAVWSDDTGHLWAGDNVAVMRELALSETAQVSLAYLDPPYLTQRTFETSARAVGGVSTAFDDHWESRAEYLKCLAERLVAVRDLLAPWGCVVIHVDPKTSHYVRVLADKIFGEQNFVSEIIWRYRRWPSKQQNFQRVHDCLLRYRKDASVPGRWTQLYEPLAASTQATWGDRKQLARFDGAGKRVCSSSTSAPSPGVPMGDVWDIGVIAPVAKERTGYPTQKPEALLERLLTSLTLPGDLVLDPYAGSGTTLAVSAKLGRRYWGIDKSEVALATAGARLSSMVSAPPTSERRLRAAQAPSEQTQIAPKRPSRSRRAV